MSNRVTPTLCSMTGTGYVPALVLLVVFSCAAAYMMYLIGSTVTLTGQDSYDRIWADVIGERTSWIPLLVVSLVCAGNCLAYACFYGDLFSFAMPSLGMEFMTRGRCIMLISTFPVLPLCMLKDLSALAPTSFGALMMVIYTVATIVYRCFDGSYAEGGHFYKPPPTPAERGDSHTFTLGFSTLLLVNSLSVAFLCHYNGCKYYREFVRHSPGRFFNTVGTAFAAIDIIFMVAMVAGYSTFGSLSQGVILNNYAFSDMPANIARLGMGAANMLSFPLMFSGLREAVLALIAFSCPSYAPLCDQVWYQNILSGIMVGVISLSAVIITDASLVVGLVGSICGSAIIYVIPCLLYERASHRFNLGNDKPPGFSLVAVRAIGAVLLECFS
eukprot:TRINITY_DN14237_c0_g1_i7.p1 TRINITY_DN14237_c0_g1~~TRINITY_DN14237_c0_g1_i7.p1  ORF type:complete len:410 (+),score=25.75 TRINITY_DN14237_c0_g1_i7:74-1231(+)